MGRECATGGRNGFSGEAYQRALDQIIYWNSLYGAYTILDLQWLDADRICGGKDNYVAPFPMSLPSNYGSCWATGIGVNRPSCTICSMSLTTDCLTTHIP
jgi:hypothetical protein